LQAQYLEGFDESNPLRWVKERALTGDPAAAVRCGRDYVLNLLSSGGGFAQGLQEGSEFGLGELAMLSGFHLVERQGTHLRTNQAQRRVSNCSRHLSDLPIAALCERYLEP
jgi:hypothetical protein